MAEMTPRERSELVRSQSRAYIASLRQRRLERTGQSAPLPPTATLPGKRPSAFLPSRQATARASGSLEHAGAGATRTQDIKVTPSRPIAGGVVRTPAPAVRRRTADQPNAAAPAARLAAESPGAESTGAGVIVGELRQARRSGKAKASKGHDAAQTAKDGSETEAVGTAMAKPICQEPPQGAATDAVHSAPVLGEPAATPPAPRRARPKRSAPPEGLAAPPQDIDVISGLGPALKTKLRRAGIGTAEVLASQKPERLREVLGPAGRLVNLEALVRAAAAACAEGTPTTAASPRGARPPAPSRSRV